MSDGVFASDLARVRAALNGLTVETVKPYLDSLSGEIHASLPALSAEAGRQFATAVASRQAGEQQGRAVATELRSESGTVLWGQALGTFGKLSSGYGTAGLDYDITGLAIGVDSMVGDVRLGLAGGYSKTEVEQDARHASADIDSWHVGGYAMAALGQGFLDAQLGYSRHAVDTRRQLMVGATATHPEARGNANADEFRASLTAGRVYTAGTFSARPNIGLAYRHVGQGGLSEAGAGGMGLAVAKNCYEALTADLGIEAGYALGGLRPFVSLAGSHDLVQEGYAATARFLGGGDAFRITATEAGRSAVMMGAGLDAKLGQAVELRASYGYEGRAKLDAHRVSATLSWHW